MNPTLVQDIIRELTSDRFAMKPKGAWLRNGICPACGGKDFYAKADNPWMSKCGSLNKCGREFTAKELMPDLFDDWSKRFKRTEAAPNAAADAYLANMRGFDVARLKGAYTQESYRDPETGQSSATVRFPLPGGGWWERLIDRVYRFSSGKRKAGFAYGVSTQGIAWLPPTLDIDKLATLKEIWLVEGIFDAIALGHHGIDAVSVMSSNNYPSRLLSQLKASPLKTSPKLIWALDGDHAGRSYTLKHVSRARADGWQCDAATIPLEGGVKRDWNDLHLAEKLSSKDIEEHRYHGAVLIAGTPKERALLMYTRTKSTQFSLEFGNRLYWFEFDASLYASALKESKNKNQGDDDDSEQDDQAEAKREAHARQLAAKVLEIANCNPEPLYFQKNLLTGEHWYYVRVTTPRGGTVKDTFRGEQLVAAGEFKKRLMSVVAGASFYGTTQQLDRHWSDDLQVIKHVESIDFVGYSREHRAYLLGQVAVKDGSVIMINEEDFFDLGKRMHVKSPTKSVALAISQQADSFRTDWVDKAWKCWGEVGMVGLTFWFASLFAEQIRAEQESFPFLELIGMPGSGKSTMVRFYWKLLGRAAYEGLDPSKSTLAARARNFVQVANLPVVLVEGDRKDDTARAKKFDFNELKTAYNGGSIRALGVKSAGNETIEPPFRGAIVIEQNATVLADRAVLERIVHINVDKSRHSAENKALAEELARMEMSSLSYFILLATRREAEVMATIKANVPRYEKELSAKVKDLRLVKNHAQLLAAYDALCQLLPITDEQRSATSEFIRKMAVQRQNALAEDHPVVQHFWEIYDYINPQGGDKPVLNHSKNPDHIAVSLPQFDAEAAARYMSRPTITDLKEHLRTSTTRKFVDVKNVKSEINGRATWCFVFKAPPKAAPPTE